MSKHVLSVGNCGPDHRAITAMIESHFQAEVVAVDDLTQTLAHLKQQPVQLVLVNRILDRDGGDGLEVIRHIKETPRLSNTPVMLITNFPEHQQSAQEIGAAEGFGKQALQTPETRAKLEPFLGPDS